MSDQQSKKNNVSRRGFLATSGGTAAALTLANLPQVHAAGNDTLRIALIGCGSRGTGAATQALKADPNVRLVAMADAFGDRIERSLAELRRDEAIANKITVPADKQFVGFDGFQQAISSGVDVVLLCSPPHFRAAHIEAAVRAGKHIFAEKPVAVDAPGVRRVLAACQDAQRRNLSVVTGLCWRYHGGMREVMNRVHEGAIGEILAMHTSYYTGTLWHVDRTPQMKDMEWQMRNWLYFTWLSGDHIVEQHIHSLDKMAWAMRDQYPATASGTGGRQVRVEPQFGHIFDHHAVTFEYGNGVKCFSYTRQQAGCNNDVTDHIIGTQGVCHIVPAQNRYEIVGRNAWRYPTLQARRDNMYQNEHNELFASIRSGTPINNGDFMSKSSLMAIMGRMATYTGQVIAWEQALNSREDLTPARYDWDLELPVPPVARPGITQFS